MFFFFSFFFRGTVEFYKRSACSVSDPGRTLEGRMVASNPVPDFQEVMVEGSGGK